MKKQHSGGGDRPADGGIRQPSRAHEKPEELTRQRISQNAFLRAFERCPIVTQAANQIGISRDTHYDWLHEDPTYRPRFQEALMRAGDALEEHALELTYGWDEAVYHEGKIVGYIRRYDTRHVREMLAATKPEKYRQRHEITGKDGKPLFDLEAIREWMRREPGPEDGTPS